MNLASTVARLERKVQALATAPTSSGYERYENDPIGYCRDVLGVELWSEQAEGIRALLKPPYRVAMPSGHSVGKTFLAACAVNWWYDTRNPGVVITTAPTERDVIDLLWTEVRLQRQRAGLGGFRGDKSPELYTSPEHYAKGYTAREGTSFQGRHRERMFFVFDEAEGVHAEFFRALNTMFIPGAGHAALIIYNPTQTDSPTVSEEAAKGVDGNPKWFVKRLSSLDHPNIAAELRGEPPPIPNAVSLSQVKQWIGDWCDEIEAADANANDIEFPPASGRWWRPGPVAEARILGRRPTQAVNSVWSQGLWQKVLETRHEIRDEWPVQIGCDVARFGDDDTSIHVRRGLKSLHHESHNGWSTKQTAERLRYLAYTYATGDPKKVLVAVDVSGVGAGVVDQAEGYDFVGVNSSHAAQLEDRYHNIRSELWFVAADAARHGLIDVASLPASVLTSLSSQLQSPVYVLDTKGRMKVEAKADTKKRLNRSPDDADAFNLAYYPILR